MVTPPLSVIAPAAQPFALSDGERLPQVGYVDGRRRTRSKLGHHRRQRVEA
jgi:hypothetical protein